MSQITLMPGTVLRHNTYRIDGVLGQGGFGITYLAADISLDKRVAIKEFFPKEYCDREPSTSHVTLGTQSTAEFVEKLKAKFLKEAKNIAKFDHPNIIKIHAAFEENNTAYYVMDFIEGESLSERVKRDGSLPQKDALNYIEKVGDALSYVHSFRMNHLDVKPANIMVRRADNCPILIDFGLSKQYDSEGNQTSSTPIGISHGYAPMEQYNDGGISEFSPTTDEYSLAATLYYLLSGVVPPQSTKLIEEELPFPQTIPANLIGPIHKAMSSARKDRYSTVKEFIAALTAKPTATVQESTVLINQQLIVEPTSPLKPQQRKEVKTEQESEKWSIIRGTIYTIILMIAVAMSLIVLLERCEKEADSNSDYLDASITTSTPIKNQTPTSTPIQTPTPKQHTVKDMSYRHNLGKCSFTGEVDDYDRPNGRGVANWTSGEAWRYDGEWIHGVMHGEALYTLRNGDTFKGTFHYGKYNHGRYKVKSTGDYFEGTFKEGQPYQGTWYDKNGNKLNY